MRRSWWPLANSQRRPEVLVLVALVERPVKATNTLVSWGHVSVVKIVHSPDARDGQLHGNANVVVPPAHLARVRLLDCEHTRALECIALCWWSYLRTFSKGSLWCLDQDAEVAQLVVHDLEHLALLHGEREKVPGEAYATNAESIAHLEAHRL